MKIAHLLAASLAALALWTNAASAQTVAIAPIAISAELQEDLTDKLGAREADTLRNMLARNLTRALEHQGLAIGPGAALTIEPEIIDADPNRPTFTELTRNTSLSYADSYSTGGAELRATLRSPNGAQEITYRHYSPNLDDLVFPSTWYDADRAMWTFARRVARAAKEQAQ